ncbi:MAG: restriction endonuclease [Roseburia sp.]|nr:restriction endonuclease [Roseburia sp.]
MTENEILNFISGKNYDIRVHRNARWIDQKCTPDVLCIVADCIVNYLDECGNNVEFTSNDIWFSEYAIQNVHDIFSKVDVDSSSASNEYDKFFGQPIKLFAYSGLLSESKKGRCNVYKIVSRDILEFIALRERNALIFLTHYINKVIADSDLKGIFDEFFEVQTKDSYNKLKDTFYNFTVANTEIGSKGSDGKLECGRIFTKVINVLAFNLKKRGTERGHISKYAITYDMLMYNRDNFRDIYADKPKDISRKDFLALQHIVINEAYFTYQSQKAKRRLRKYNDKYRNGLSEMPNDNEKATHIHHIFSASDYPEISFYLENLIALTPNQHLNHAHPNGNTQTVDRDYQHDCLIVKTDNIKDNLENAVEKIYSFSDFLRVLYIGFNEEAFLEIEQNDYDGIKTKIELEYIA